jgi:hypothetical protein
MTRGLFFAHVGRSNIIIANGRRGCTVPQREAAFTLRLWMLNRVSKQVGSRNSLEMVKVAGYLFLMFWNKGSVARSGLPPTSSSWCAGN